jgi:peptidoglycan/LPS O-acetylase OafA/YrhL
LAAQTTRLACRSQILPAPLLSVALKGHRRGHRSWLYNAQVTFNIGAISGDIQRRLSRITSTDRFLPEIDGLRFVAIVSVLAYHINGYYSKHGNPDVVAHNSRDWLNAIFLQGNFGVPLFFAISGFILGLPFAEQYLCQGKPVDIKKYFVRRITRIEPPYLIALLVYTLLIVLTGRRTLASLLPHLFAQMSYVTFLVYRTVPDICFVGWSLEIEVQFYLLAPLLSKIFLLRPAPFRRAAILATMLASACCPHVPFLGMNLLDVLHYFLSGFLLADVYISNWRECPSRSRIWDLFGMLSWIGLLTVLLNHFWVQYTAPLLVFAAHASAFRGRALQWLFTRPWLVTIGGMCYTTYLYHPLIKSFFGKWTSQLTVTNFYWVNTLLQVLILFCLIEIVSAVLFVVAEKPFMQRDWPTRFARALTAYARLWPGAAKLR